MLDSGAFSAWNRGAVINLQDYIAFCLDNHEMVDYIINLDVIPSSPFKKVIKGDRKDSTHQGWNNYRTMLNAGISKDKLIHVFHQGEDMKWLKRMIKQIPYIGLSPANDKTTKQKRLWLDQCMNYIIDDQGNPVVKFHGFAVTTLKLVFRYPWTSVDSSSWQLRGGGYGLIDVPENPKTLFKKEDYYIRSIPIGKGVKGYGKDIQLTPLFFVDKISQCDATFLKSPIYKKNLESFLNQYGFTLEELQNDSRLRAAWNAIYQITSISKFTNIILYLATSDLKSVDLLCKKMEETQLDTNSLNILISFASIGKKSTKLLDLIKLLK